MGWEFVFFWESYQISHLIGCENLFENCTLEFLSRNNSFDEVKMGKNQELVAINKATPVD